MKRRKNIVLFDSLTRKDARLLKKWWDANVIFGKNYLHIIEKDGQFYKLVRQFGKI